MIFQFAAHGVKAALLAIESALLAIDSALLAIDSALLAIDSALRAIDSALRAIESALLAIESAPQGKCGPPLRPLGLGPRRAKRGEGQDRGVGVARRRRSRRLPALVFNY